MSQHDFTIRAVRPSKVLLALTLACGCRQTRAEPPPSGGTLPAPADQAASDPREGSGAVDGPTPAEDAADAPAATRRERPSPAAVSDREGAFAALTHGNPEGAREFLRELVRKTPGDLEARVGLARALVATGAASDALAVLEDKAGTPLDVAVVLLRVDILRRRGQQGAAEKVLEQALVKHPNALSLQGESIAMRVATGRRGEARTKTMIEAMYDGYDAGKATTAEDLLGVAHAAIARGGKGGFHDANMVLEQAEAKAPVEQGSWIGDRVRLLRAAIFLEKYALDDAQTTLELILARDPWHPDVLADLARVHLEGLRFAAAARAAEEALLVDASHPEAQAALARIALIEGRRAEARTRVTDKVLPVDPGHPRGLAVVAAAAIAAGDEAGYRKARDRVLAQNPHDGPFFEDLSDILGFLHLYPEADQVLREGEGKAPDDAYVQSALGLNLLRLGDEVKGRAALQKAWKGDPFNERTRNTLDLYEGSLDKAYTVDTVDGFTVRAPSEDRDLVVPVLRASAQRSRKALDEFYGVRAGDLRLEFFATPEEFSVRTVGVPSLGAVAVCFGPVITFIGPYAGAVNLDLVTRHELAHVYAIRRSKGRVPRWFTEGLSEWESEIADPAWARESAALLTEARRRGKLRKLSELELAFIRAESPVMMEVAYSTAAYAMRYLGQTYGRPKLVAVLDGYAKGRDTPELFAAVLGKELSTVEREFEAWLADQLAHKVSGWHPSSEEKSDDPRDRLFRTAHSQLASNKVADGIKTLERLVSVAGGDGFAPRMLLAQALLAGKDPSHARRHLEAARKFNVESIEPHARLAEVARKAGDAIGEKSILRQALGIDANSLDPAARLLMLALVTDDNDNVRYAGDRARSIAPLHPIVLAADAIALAQAKKIEAAKTRITRAEKALAASEDRGPADTHVVLAIAKAAAGDASGARALAQKLLTQPEIGAAARKRLGKL